MSDLWSLVWGKPEIDPDALAEAVGRELDRHDLDFRTRLLIRDSTETLKQYWGRQRWARWLAHHPARRQIEAIRQEPLGEPCFPSLKERLMPRTEAKTIEQFLRELGDQLHKPVSIQVGGSGSLILTGHLARATEDVDVVDEVPPAIRELGPALDRLTQRYGLRLAHFQSHYLPTGWENRLRSLGPYGRLQVFVVDVLDIFLSKLFSRREKDLDDLRLLEPRVDKETLVRRLRHDARALWEDPLLRQNAEKNWYILYGETLPVSE